MLQLLDNIKNKKLLALIILSIAAILSLSSGIYNISKKGRRAILPVVTAEKKEDDLSEDIAIRSAKKSAYTTWGKNPFLLGAVPETDLNLSGILWDDKRPLAIINDICVDIGSKIGRNTVIDITEDRVILNDGTANFELKLDR